MKALEEFDPNESKKSLLGNYSSSRMQEWNNILKLYQAKNIHLAESGSNMVTWFTYEMWEQQKYQIPNSKTEIFENPKPEIAPKFGRKWKKSEEK